MRTRLVVLSLLAIAALLLVGAAGQENLSRGRGKVAPWVMAQTDGGAEAEFLVVLADRPDLSAAEWLATKEEKGRYVRDLLLARAQAAQGPLLDWLRERGVAHRPFYIVNAIWVRGPREVAEALAARPEVERLEGNPQIQQPPVEPEGDESERLTRGPSAVEPGVSYIRAPEVWAMGFTGQGLTIGGADTGVEWAHPALRARYRGTNGEGASHDYNWHDAVHAANDRCPPDAPEPCDDSSHGTHTVGTAVGEDDAGSRIGVAPGAQFIACRNMNRGAGTPASYLECFEFFLAPYPTAATPAEGDPAKAPDVTINSWGCPPSEGCAPETLRAAVEAHRAAGIMTVVSAGNRGPGCATVIDPPAHYDAAYTVGAFNAATGEIAPFSSRGPVALDASNRPKPDLTAPGVGVRSSVRGGAYGTASGTSMAAPHVAGAIALLWSARPFLRGQVARTEEILNLSAVPVTAADCAGAAAPNNVYGHGRLDVRAAVEMATSGALFGIAGRVAHAGGNGAEGVILTFQRLSGGGIVPPPARTDAAGRWSQTGFEAGTTYRVTPSESRQTFAPRWLDFEGGGAALDFTILGRRVAAARAFR